MLRIVPHLVEDEQPRAEPEGLGDVVGDHEDGHAGLAPERQQQRRACRARMPGSSAPNGSSSSSIFGCFSSAWAIASRCCMPPESCAGIAVARMRRGRCWSSIASASSLRACARRAEQRGRGRGARSNSSGRMRFSQHRQVRKHRIALEDDAAVGRRLGGSGAPSTRIAPRVGRSWPSSRRRKVDLPQPDAPTMVTKAPALDREVDALQDRRAVVARRQTLLTSTKLIARSPPRCAQRKQRSRTEVQQRGRARRRAA